MKTATVPAGLQQVFLDRISDIYYAQEQTAHLLPALGRAARCADLARTLESHAADAGRQLGRLDRVLAMLGVASAGKTSSAVDELFAEGRRIPSLPAFGGGRDDALISFAQKLEQYKVGTYAMLASVAAKLGLVAVERELDASLLDEKRAGEKLARLSLLRRPAAVS